MLLHERIKSLSPEIQEQVLAQMGVSGVANADTIYADFIDGLVETWLEDMEDLEACRRYDEKVKNGTVKYYTIDEVRAELGL